MIKNLFSSNKREFFPGKAYLIEDKSIEQVRSKIKEWLEKNEIDILYDCDNLIEGYSLHEVFSLEYDTWIYLKLLQESSGTVVVFHHKIYNKRSLLPNLEEQKRIDLIRFIEGKEELDIDISSFIINFYTYPLIVWFLSNLLFIYITTKFFYLPEVFKALCVVFSFMILICYGHYAQKRALSLAKLPNHYVEEYDKRIDFFYK